MQQNIKVNVIEQTNIIHVKNVIAQETREALVAKVLAFKDTHPATEGTNPNCWRGSPHIHPESDQGFDDETNILLRNIIADSKQLFIDTQQRPYQFAGVPHIVDRYDQENVLLHAWFNVNGQGGANITHTHTGNFMSGVLYLQGTGTGEIEFYTQNYLYNIEHPCSPYYGTARYQPEDGDLLLFPSHLAHHVVANPGTRERINMAFNVEYPFRSQE